MPHGDFSIRESLGQGAFGKVYKVVRRADGKEYAMKKVNVGSMSPKEAQDAVSEIRFLASVHHPNVVAFLEAYIEPGTGELCCVQEICDGGDLHAFIQSRVSRRAHVPEAQVWNLFLQMVAGIARLHDTGICHRDLKAQNIFLKKIRPEKGQQQQHGQQQHGQRRGGAGHRGSRQGQGAAGGVEGGLQIKIGDLNVSKKLVKGSMASTQIGTPYYIAPE